MQNKLVEVYKYAVAEPFSFLFIGFRNIGYSPIKIIDTTFHFICPIKKKIFVFLNHHKLSFVIWRFAILLHLVTVISRGTIFFLTPCPFSQINSRFRSQLSLPSDYCACRWSAIRPAFYAARSCQLCCWNPE